MRCPEINVFVQQTAVTVCRVQYVRRTAVWAVLNWFQVYVAVGALLNVSDHKFQWSCE